MIRLRAAADAVADFAAAHAGSTRQDTNSPRELKLGLYAFGIPSRLR